MALSEFRSELVEDRVCGGDREFVGVKIIAASLATVAR